MNRALLTTLLLFCLCVHYGSAQDSIFLQSGDTLVGRIKNITRQHIFATCINAAGRAENLVIPIRDVAEYRKFADVQAQLNSNNRTQGGKKVLPYQEKYFFAAPFFGGSYRIGFLDPAMNPIERQYYSRLLYGPEYGALLGYHYRKNLFFGLTAQMFRAKTSLDEVTVTANINGTTVSRYGTISDVIRHWMIGPVWGRKFLRNYSPRCFGMQYSAGFASFRQDSHVLYRQVYASQSMYLHVGLTYESNMMASTSVFVTGGLTTATFRTIKVRDLDHGTEETLTGTPLSLARFTLTLGVRFR